MLVRVDVQETLPVAAHPGKLSVQTSLTVYSYRGSC